MRFALVLMSAVLALCGGTAIAQPSLERGPEPDIAERGSAHYTFETLMLEAPGSERRYRIQIARPRLAPPPAGYPAIFLSAALAVLVGFGIATGLYRHAARQARAAAGNI